MFKKLRWGWGILLLIVGLQPVAAQTSYSLRFYGHGDDDLDRVKIALSGSRPVNMGATDFTIEFWMKASAAENTSGSCQTASNDTWINGNTIIDRDIYGNGDHGDYGISLYGGRIAFGVDNGSNKQTRCGSTNVADGQWHHIAVTRRFSDGYMQIYVDGQLDAQGSGPSGNISYRIGRSTNYPDSDPFIVIGAEKHDVGPNYPSFSGFLDELRFSTTLRYTSAFTAPTSPFSPDAQTVGLYHFDEGTGNTVGDSSGAAGGPSTGTRKYGGSPAGPVWSTDTPINVGVTPTEAAPLLNYFVSDNQEVTWSRVSWAAAYEIQVASDSVFSLPLTHSATVPGDNLAAVLPALGEGRYYWRVRPQQASGTWGIWSIVSSFTIELP